jgi:hypothetical protein
MKGQRNCSIRRVIKALTLDNTPVTAQLLPQRLTFMPPGSPIRPSCNLKTGFPIPHPTSRIISPLDLPAVGSIDTCSLPAPANAHLWSHKRKFFWISAQQKPFQQPNSVKHGPVKAHLCLFFTMTRYPRAADHHSRKPSPLPQCECNQ